MPFRTSQIAKASFCFIAFGGLGLLDLSTMLKMTSGEMKDLFVAIEITWCMA